MSLSSISIISFWESYKNTHLEVTIHLPSNLFMLQNFSLYSLFLSKCLTPNIPIQVLKPNLPSENQIHLTISYFSDSLTDMRVGRVFQRSPLRVVFSYRCRPQPPSISQTLRFWSSPLILLDFYLSRTLIIIACFFSQVYFVFLTFTFVLSLTPKHFDTICGD